MSGNFWIRCIILILTFLIVVSVLPIGRPSDFGTVRYTTIGYDYNGDPIILQEYTYREGFQSVEKSFRFGFGALKSLFSPLLYAYNIFFGQNYVLIPLYLSFSDGEYTGREFVITSASTFAAGATYEVVYSSIPGSTLKIHRNSVGTDYVYIYIDGAPDPLVYYFDTETPNGEDWIQYSSNFNNLVRVGLIWKGDGVI